MVVAQKFEKVRYEVQGFILQHCYQHAVCTRLPRQEILFRSEYVLHPCYYLIPNGNGIGEVDDHSLEDLRLELKTHIFFENLLRQVTLSDKDK